MPSSATNPDPLFFFMLTPANAGSTAIADFFCQIENVTGLSRNYEGQWLVPGLSDEQRWNADKVVNYHSVRAVWLAEFEKRRLKKPSLSGVFEKSPPNLLRFSSLQETFPHSRFVVNNRNPYASIASRFFRYHLAGAASAAVRTRKLQELAIHWLETSRHLREAARSANMPVLSYEQFCEEPSQIFDVFGIENYEAQVKKDYRVTVKDYEPQRIRNMNEKQMGKLTTEDTKNISDVLRTGQEILDFFGYRLYD